MTNKESQLVDADVQLADAQTRVAELEKEIEAYKAFVAARDALQNAYARFAVGEATSEEIDELADAEQKARRALENINGVD